MWRITLVLTALLMGVFGLGCAASQIKLGNHYIQYPNVGEAMPPLPAISDIALRCQWLLKAMPLAWAFLTLAVLILNWRKSEAPQDLIQLHTSATILVGMFMLGFFVTAGVMPFVSIVVSMR